MKYLFVALSFMLLSLFACQKPVCSDASTCTAFSPPEAHEPTCMMLVSGYYYDEAANKCKFYEGGGCVGPPFELKADCEECECRD